MSTASIPNGGASFNARVAPIRIGLALSGGGFRAAAYHLGVLKRLEEFGVLASIEALSTVSGGSITGALYALRCAEHGGAPGSYAVYVYAHSTVSNTFVISAGKSFQIQ